MTKNNLIEKLNERGLIAQLTDQKKLVELVVAKSIVLYCGFDPTADSLHLGHLVPLLSLKRFQLAGHRPIVLVGGATGLIGDPSFKITERTFNDLETIQLWTKKIKNQISLFLDFDCGNNSAIAVNNYDWFSSMNILMFLRDIGKHFSINKMINKEVVKKRLRYNSEGISFTGFSYSLLQGYDFAYLSKHYGVMLQIGGSDQWGNIISGIDLTRKLYQNEVHGLTVPLITKADGSKFGKTEDGTVWLDPNKTSPYKFYQFWINTTDSDVFQFLKFFTFLSLSTIRELEEEFYSRDKANIAQYMLAEEVTRLVHGNQGLVAAKRISTSLFTGLSSELTKEDFAQLAQDGMPKIEVEHGVNLQHALILANLVSSYSQARSLINANAITINGKKQMSPKYTFTDTDKLYGRYTLIRRGKKHYCLLEWQ